MRSKMRLCGARIKPCPILEEVQFDVSASSMGKHRDFSPNALQVLSDSAKSFPRGRVALRTVSTRMRL